jgi:hypothetical protein
LGVVVVGAVDDAGVEVVGDGDAGVTGVVRT